MLSPICCERQPDADYRLAGLGARINFGYTDCNALRMVILQLCVAFNIIWLQREFQL